MTIEEMKKWKRTLGMTSEEISSPPGFLSALYRKSLSGVTTDPPGERPLMPSSPH